MTADARTLTYEDMLGELQALLGRFVAVWLTVTIAGEEHPVGMLQGTLRRAVDTDFSKLPDGTATPFPAGELMLFSVGDPPPVGGIFFVTRDRFRLGRKATNGDLSFMTGHLRTGIIERVSDE